MDFYSNHFTKINKVVTYSTTQYILLFEHLMLGIALVFKYCDFIKGTTYLLIEISPDSKLRAHFDYKRKLELVKRKVEIIKN